MKLSRKRQDMEIILHYTGTILIGFSPLYLIPIITSTLCAEYAVAVDFAISLGATLTIGAGLASLFPAAHRTGWLHGMVTAGISWLAAMACAALPYRLSGHYLSYLDAMFDVMSGLTTTGLTLIQDLDHVSNGLNMWRHVLTFVGGQGIIVLALALFVDGSGGGYGFYVGEGKDERLFPSVMNTAKSIWRISILYLVIGTLAFWIAGLLIGMAPMRAFFQGLWIFMAAWSTGGFAPMSQNVLYYHSALYEGLAMVFFIIGSFNFALHAAAMRGNKKELVRNIEIVSFTTTLCITATLCCWGLAQRGAYPDIIALFRKGFYQLVSAHTTTGFMTIYARQFHTEWSDLAVLAVIIAMMIGGSACSTAGGMKGLRVGILFKAIIQDTKRLLKPSAAVSVQKIRYHGVRVLSEQQVRSAALVVIMYVGLFASATMAGCLAGFPLLDAAFESASVTGNVGLSIGVTAATMPAMLKIVYIFAMWAGRLEFMAVLAVIGFAGSFLKRRPA